MRLLSGARTRKRLLVGCVFGAILLVSGVWYWQNYLDSRKGSVPKELRESAAKQEKIRLSDAEVNKINSLQIASNEIRSLINTQMYKEAKTKLDVLAKEQASNSAAQDTIYGLYVQICSSLLDITCMHTTLDYFKSSDVAYFTVAVQFGESATSSKKIAAAKKFYQIALATADKNGGQEFVDAVNKANKERQYDYSQVKQSAL